MIPKFQKFITAIVGVVITSTLALLSSFVLNLSNETTYITIFVGLSITIAVTMLEQQLLIVFQEQSKDLQNDIDEVKANVAVLKEEVSTEFAALKTETELGKLYLKLDTLMRTHSLEELFNFDLNSNIVPVFVHRSSAMPSFISNDSPMIIVFDSAQALPLFEKCFDLIRESYWGTSYVTPKTWKAGILDETISKQQELVKQDKTIRRVFIVDDEEELETVKPIIDQQREREIECQSFDLSKLEPGPIQSIWSRYWDFYLNPTRPNRIPILSPDFSIIDRKILISHMIDRQRNHVGAVVFFEPDFLDEMINYFDQLYKETLRKDPN